MGKKNKSIKGKEILMGVRNNLDGGGVRITFDSCNGRDCGQRMRCLTFNR